MTDHTLSGPDFLDSVADAEEANNNYINAAEYRRRATQWREAERALLTAEARLVTQMDAAREDAALLDFLADREQNVANVMLPGWAALEHYDCLRTAIRAVMHHVKAAEQTKAASQQEAACHD